MIKSRTNFPWYYDHDVVQNTAMSMTLFGAETFHQASIIKHLPLIKQTIIDRQNEKISHNDFCNFVHPFIFEKLVDAFKICLFFENFLKAELLRKNYLIHKIKRGSKYDALAKEQYQRPIQNEELHLLEKFEIDIDEKSVYHNGLTTQTLMMSTMLENKRYDEVIQLPEDTKIFLIDLVEKRNELHFVNQIEFELSLEYVDRLTAIKDFVNQMTSRYSTN